MLSSDAYLFLARKQLLQTEVKLIEFSARSYPTNKTLRTLQHRKNATFRMFDTEVASNFLVMLIMGLQERAKREIRPRNTSGT